MSIYVNVVGKKCLQPMRYRSGERRTFQVEEWVDIKHHILCRDGNEEIVLASSGDKCHDTNHFVKPGTNMFRFSNSLYCQEHYLIKPTLEKVQRQYSGPTFNVSITTS